MSGKRIYGTHSGHTPAVRVGENMQEDHTSLPTLLVTKPHCTCAHQVRKMAGVFLYCLKQAAKPISTDESNCHRRRIEEDQEFYKNWLFPRLEQFYRQQGWPIGDALAAEGTASSGSSNPSNKKKKKSRRSCPSVKRVFKRLKFTRRRDQPPVDVLHPRVGAAFSSHADLLLQPHGAVPCVEQQTHVSCLGFAELVHDGFVRRPR